MGNTVNIKTKAFEFSNGDDTVYIHCRLDYNKIDKAKNYIFRAFLCDEENCVPDCNPILSRRRRSMMKTDKNHVDIAIGPISIRK